MKTQSINAFRRCVAGVLSLTMALGPMVQVAQAVNTTLTDIPIASKVTAKPNIFYTLDDSGSMMLSYIPDYVIAGPGVAAPNTYGPGYCRNTAGTGTVGCNTTFNWGREVPMFTADFNRLYYNPNVTYDPPADKNGRQSTVLAPDPAAIYQPQDAANTTNWTAVYSDPYLTPATKVDLVSAVAGKGLVSVPLFCNTDWPSSATYPAFPIAEVGNALGEFSASAGRDCRINGTNYATINGAPVTADDYNYPWNKTVAPDDPKYFFRNQSTNTNRVIWCDKTAASWPKTCVAGAPTCGGTITVTPPVAQTCYFSGNATTTGAPFTYNPAGCDTNPLYQASGWVNPSPTNCVGTIGVECLACTRTGTSIVTGRNGVCHLTSSGGPPGTGGSGAGCSCAGVGCTLPACPTFDPPDTCSTGFVAGPPVCSPAGGSCNLKIGSSPAVVGSPSLLDDSNGAGVICRHNNSSGSGAFGNGTYVSNRFAYSAAATTYKTPINDSSCGAFPNTVNIPRHYYTTASVQFCSSFNAIVNDQWKGFGTGACQTKNDLTTFTYAKYGKFTRVDLVNDGRTFAYTDPFTGVSGARTFAQEMTNYSNWYAYYRTRILAAKTTAAIAFNIIDNTYRAGFHTMNTSATNWLNMADFDAAQRLAWYNMLFSIPITAGAQTPTLDALIRIGDVVEKGAGAVPGLPAHTDPFPPISAINSNPVTCTNNFHVLFTDGSTNQPGLPTVAGEVDGGTVPAASATVLPPDPGATAPERTIASLHAAAGGAWPFPYADNPTKTANTLADIALYYWMRDLRPGPVFVDNVPSNDGRSGADLDWNQDPAWWQHVNFSAISFGSDGVLDASNAVTTLKQLAHDPLFPPALNWPAPTTPNHPGVAPPAVVGGTLPQMAIDDLWHATANGRGTFVYAKSPIEVSYGFGNILSGISNNRKARVGGALLHQQLSATNNFLFQATIEPGWAGELKKAFINPVNGNFVSFGWGNKGAGAILNTQLATPAPGTSPALDKDNAWFLNRRIVTRNVDNALYPPTVVPFTYAALNVGAATQLNTLSTDPVQQQKIVSYLRGGSTFGNGPSPPLIEGVAIGQFRKRFGKLGNISDSKPLVIGPPSAPFTDTNDAGYSLYKGAHSTRPLRVFVGANDGMVHVFDGTDDAVTGGSETFAFIPSGVFTTAKDDGGKFPKGLQALTYQDGGAPIFKHHFYVNASPRTQDVDFNNCGTNSACTADWRTIVVGGLGKGGNTIYAIDATDVVSSTTSNPVGETQAASKILWEFSIPNEQTSYGRPIIAKTYADGWVVIVAGGYNNSLDGKGHVHILKAKDGTLIRTLNTTPNIQGIADPGIVGSPSGLTQINGFTKDSHNQFVEQIYGGDLNGHVWRWDVHDPIPANWKTDLIARAVDPSGAAQPITTSPQIEIDINNGVDRFVFLGTGKLLDASDFTFPIPEQIETMYAFRDGTLAKPATAGFPITPRGFMADASGATAAISAPNGWFEDLALGQRIVVDPVADLNLVSYAGTKVQADPCLTALPASVYARDFATADNLIVNGGLPYFDVLEGIVDLQIVAFSPVAGASFPSIGVLGFKETTGDAEKIPVRLRSFTGGLRLSWRILGE